MPEAPRMGSMNTALRNRLPKASLLDYSAALTMLFHRPTRISQAHRQMLWITTPRLSGVAALPSLSWATTMSPGVTNDIYSPTGKCSRL